MCSTCRGAGGRRWGTHRLPLSPAFTILAKPQRLTSSGGNSWTEIGFPPSFSFPASKPPEGQLCFTYRRRKGRKGVLGRPHLSVFSAVKLLCFCKLHLGAHPDSVSMLANPAIPSLSRTSAIIPPLPALVLDLSPDFFQPGDSLPFPCLTTPSP